MENFGYTPDYDAIDEFASSLPTRYENDVRKLIRTDDDKDALLYRPLVKCLLKCDDDVKKRWLKKDGDISRLVAYAQLNIGSCFIQSTPIMMADGSQKPIEEIQIGDEVITHTGNKRRVLRTFKLKYTGELHTVHTKGNIYPLTMTHDHKMPVLINNGTGNLLKLDGRFRKCKAYDLNIGDRLILSYGLQDNIQHSIDILSSIENKIDCKHDNNIIKYRNKQCKRHINVDESFARLIGLYLAEGGVHYINNIYDGIIFSLGAHEEILAQEICELIKKIFICDAKIAKYKSRPSVISVKVNNRIVGEFFHSFINGNVYNKYVPTIFFSCDKCIKLALIRGWLDGDGHTKIYKKCDKLSFGSRGVSVSPDLVRGMFQLCLSCKLKTNIYQRKARKQSKTAYDLYLNGNNALQIYPEMETAVRKKISPWKKFGCQTQYGFGVPITKITKLYVEDIYVYNIEVEEEHTYIAGNIVSFNCVGNAESLCLSVEAAIDILQRREPEEFMYMASPEGQYAIGREAGDMLGNQDGSYGSAMAKGEMEIGTIWQTIYGNIDVRVYTVKRCKEWGRTGIPDELKPIAAEHKLKSAYLIKSAEEAWALIGAGHTINQCSMLGFSDKRDEDGACKQVGSWAHSMAIIGRRVARRTRKLFLIMNSWGDDYHKGPLFEDQPPGSFYADYEDVAKAIKQGDTFVKIDINGIKRRKINWEEW